MELFAYTCGSKPICDSEHQLGSYEDNYLVFTRYNNLEKTRTVHHHGYSRKKFLICRVCGKSLGFVLVRVSMLDGRPPFWAEGNVLFLEKNLVEWKPDV